jgi:hypothetical protein
VGAGVVSDGALRSIHSRAWATMKLSASVSVSKREPEMGRSLFRWPAGVECRMVATADHLRSFIYSAAAAIR